MTPCDYAKAYTDGYRVTVRTLQRRGLNLTEAEEIAQAAWVKGWQRSAQLHDARRITNWVRKIAINLWRDFQRRQRRVCALGAGHDAPASPPESLASIDLYRVIEMSSPSQRDVLRKLLAGYSTREVARLLGISLDAVQHRISRARTTKGLGRGLTCPPTEGRSWSRRRGDDVRVKAHEGDRRETRNRRTKTTEAGAALKGARLVQLGPASRKRSQGNFMKPPSEELIKKYFPTVEVRRGWFGRLLFHDRASGLRGFVSRRRVDVVAKDPAIQKAAYLPMARLGWEVFGNTDVNSASAQYATQLVRFKCTWKLRDFWSPEIAEYRSQRYISRERLIWHLEDYGLKSVTRKLFDRYIIRFHSGRRIDIRGKCVDFTKSPQHLPGEDENHLRTIICELTALANGRGRGVSTGIGNRREPVRNPHCSTDFDSKVRHSTGGVLPHTDPNYRSVLGEETRRKASF